jgi:guanylate kinase
MKVLGDVRPGLAFVISGPSAAGKTTLVGMLSDEFDCVEKSISFTTRAPRSSETPGVDYNFISASEFEEKIQNGDFLEYAKVFDRYYGTSKSFVESQKKKGKHVILVIDTQGAIQLMGSYDATFIFISPPSIEELPKRMHCRKSETKATLEHRLSWAEKEMALSSCYDYCIVNQDLHIAYQVLRSILIAEEHKTH